MGRARPDANNNFSLLAVSNADGLTPIELWADSVSHGLLVGAVQSGTWTVQPGNTPNTTPWLMMLQSKKVSSQTALTAAATVSSGAGTFHGGSFLNLNSAPAYLQVFDLTTAVTLGTTVPTFVQPIPANGTPANGAAYVFDITGGIGVVNGIQVAATTTPTGATTVPTALTGYVTYR